eukprot:46113-Hanusia_phi.AAC.1
MGMEGVVPGDACNSVTPGARPGPVTGHRAHESPESHKLAAGGTDRIICLQAFIIGSVLSNQGQ